MNYAGIKYNDVANGPGIRTSVFVSGCRLHCKGCFNPEAWDFAYGMPFDGDALDAVMGSLEPAWVDGVTFLGGDPMEPENQPAVLDALRRIRRRLDEMNAGYNEDGVKKTIWLYSGSTYEQLRDPSCSRHTELTDEILGILDVLVDGPFRIDKKDLSLRFRGSSNQRIIDMPATVAAGHVVLLEGQLPDPA